MLSINCEINVILPTLCFYFFNSLRSSVNLVSVGSCTNWGTFLVTGTKLYTPVIILVSKKNAEFLQQLESRFKKNRLL